MIDYKKYRWFLTLSGKLVVGGKSSEQNEKLVKKIVNSGKEFVVMHTSKPGSPFTFILEDINKLNEKDLEETAIFTACFSQQWKKSKRANVDTFKSSQIEKNKKMKEGTFGVVGKKESKKIKMELWLMKQKGKIRAVPFENTLNKEKIKIIPGKMDKEKVAELLSKRLNLNKEEVLMALPPGKIKIEIN